jgi:hypothetical protein
MEDGFTDRADEDGRAILLAEVHREFRCAGRRLENPRIVFAAFQLDHEIPQ